jgi:Clp amino terminal domain, pathogenicity island component
MFERYTERARRVIFFARYDASNYGSSTIESEHLLLGLLREDRNLIQRLISESCSAARSGHSERQSQLSLEGPPSSFCRRQPEIVAVDAEVRRRQSGCGMIQDVRGVQTYLERFAFRNPKRLANIRIESDRPETLNRVLS